jgi:hypothetical protein
LRAGATLPKIAAKAVQQHSDRALLSHRRLSLFKRFGGLVMSSYYLVFNPGSDYNPDHRFKFKYRYFSNDGSSCAQPVFMDYCKKGKFVMMWRWDTDAGPPVKMAECNRDKA